LLTTWSCSPGWDLNAQRSVNVDDENEKNENEKAIGDPYANSPEGLFFKLNVFHRALDTFFYSFYNLLGESIFGTFLRL
jgi:hypothetical protein